MILFFTLQVTQLKITNNPFAKAFRETATELEWDAAQVMYGPRGMLPANCFPCKLQISPTSDL